MQFGISTHIFHDRRLDRDHLAQIASYGFETIELFATRSHFDYRDESAIQQLERWLADTGLTLHGVHAPITDVFGGKSATTYSTAAGAHERREAAVKETEAALRIAARIPFGVMVLHLGTPSSSHNADDNHRNAAIRSLEEICQMADPLGVRVAAEVIPNRLSDTTSLTALLENEIEGYSPGICLDFGHAHLMGDVADAIETVAEHIITTHIHDNHGREDEHLVPYFGSIDWGLALATMQKIGYEGTYLMELAGTGNPTAVLEEARRARQRFERALTHA
ncbi:MAG TPA: sugar phosphate isomerase/epimerase [Vicinamibacterales bacterium]|jgi:sugar phosphate isomerase/epimerase